jgi:hypothetical protein
VSFVFAAKKKKQKKCVFFFFFFFSALKSRLHRALSKEIDTAKIGLIAVRLHFLATQQKQLQQQNQQLQQPSASASAPVAVAMATRDRSAHKEKEFVPATKLQLARSTPAVAGSGRSRSGRRRSDRSNNNNAVVNSSGNSGRRHYHRRRNSDPSHHGNASRARSPPARNTSPPVAAAVAAVAATAASAGTAAPTSTTTNSNTGSAAAKSASSAAVPPLPSSVVVPSFERVLTRRVDPALMPTAKRVCVMCETWLSGGAVEVPADADVFAHVSCLRCESCSLPVIDERKLKHLSAVSCFKKPGEHVFRCDVCSNGARSQRGR